ncbi:unnamed protein product [Linum tenue]|uniref:F-box domain-containing protein n=1 Tax=Linum tenue TaxID=586396 RepID=A0AAV0QNT6_9ROSI|nr:unnamed protein product [Linum tenue]
MATNNSSIAKLGDDVLAEILTRLPGPRSAFRSKAVCKRWNAFISTPCFSRRFVAHHRQIGSAAEPEPESEPEPPLPNPSNLRESILTFLPLPIAALSRFTVLDCFNDLLLLGFRSSDANDELERTFLLCNPFTKQWIALPLAAQSRPRSPGTTVSFARLVCSSNGEETSFTITQRFGYRFRVVRVCKNTAQHSATCSILDVFCSESGEWTKVALDLHGGQFGPHVDLLHFAVPLNGKLYWMNGLNQVVEWNPFRPYDQMRSSSSTDVIEIGRPFLISYSRDSFLISSSQGVLHIVLGAFSRFREVLIVWRLEEEGGGFWKKLYEVSLEKLMHSTRCNASEYTLQFEGSVAGLSRFVPITLVEAPCLSAAMAFQNSSIVELGDDLLAEVLIRLPGPRSAFRSKSVCKRWNSLISAPCFSRRFVSHHRKIGPAAAGGEPDPPFLTPSKLREWILTFLPLPIADRSRLSVLDCFEDLLLLGFRWTAAADDELRRTLLVCNPFVKQWVALPPLPVQSSPIWSYAKLVREPCNSIALHSDDDNGGRGGEAITHHSDRRFRVVRLYQLGDHRQTASSNSTLDVFCSESGEWTRVALLDIFGEFGPHRNFDVSLNGKLYWANKPAQVVEWNPFRLQDPARRTTMDDAAPFPDSMSYSLTASQGALHMILQSDWKKPEGMSLWRLEEGEGEGRSWRKLYEVSDDDADDESESIIPYDGGGGCSRPQFFTVVGHHPDKSEVFFLRCREMSQDRVYACNLRTKEAELLSDQEELNFDSTMFHQPRVHLWTTQIPNYVKLRGTSKL